MAGSRDCSKLRNLLTRIAHRDWSPVCNLRLISIGLKFEMMQLRVIASHASHASHDTDHKNYAHAARARAFVLLKSARYPAIFS